jgi:hypothetical protein
MKIKLLSLAFILIGLSLKSNGQETIVKGKVHKWPTDTVYIATLPFNSPYSTKTEFQVVSQDSIFEFSFKDIENPFVIYIAPEEFAIIQQKQSLLFDNLSDLHYYGHCIKVYTYGGSTYLVEPNSLIDIDLTFNSWIEQLSDTRAEKLRSYGISISDDNKVSNIGKTKIKFNCSDKTSLKFYQKSFDLDDKCDKTLERSKKIKSAINNLKETEHKLHSDLKKEKGNITPFLYKYIKAEIEFGARKEFLKYLRFDHEKYLSTLFNEEISDEILEIVEFDKVSIDYATLISEEYNEYLEIYLNFKISIEKGEYIIYKEFDKEKYDYALKELPEISRYFYLSNNLLHLDNTLDNKNMADKLVRDYPNGDLNNKLIMKYK